MIGMDFGTTHTKAAFIDATGKPCIVPNDRGEDTTPSTVWYSKEGDPMIGQDADEQGSIAPGGLAVNFKPALETSNNILGNGQVRTAAQAATDLLGYMKRCIERAIGCAMDDVVATCPANWRDDRKQALLDVVVGIGMNVVKLVPEPTAAAVAYCHSRPTARDRILVVDIGGGTTDVSLVQQDHSQLTVLATAGAPDLGGNDFTNVILQRVLDEVEAKHGQRPTPQDDPLTCYDILSRCERTKISMTTRPEAPVVAAFGGTQVICAITRDWFTRAAEPLVRTVLETVDQALKDAGLQKTDVDRLILAGGSSRMPLIQDALASHTGLYPNTEVDPERAIAYGAALTCVSELARQGKKKYFHGQVIPDSGMFTTEVTAYGVGCAVVDGSGASRQVLNAPIVEPNTPIPCRKSESFYLEHADQPDAHVEILQGKRDAPRDECLLIGEIHLKDLPPETTRTQRIRVEYVIDANAMVTATATDTLSGKQKTVSVDYKKGVKPKDKPRAA